MKSFGSNRIISIRFTVLSLFILMTAITAGLILGLDYFFSSRLASRIAEKNFNALSKNISEKITFRELQNSELVDMLRHYQSLGTFPEAGIKHPALPVLANAMEQNPALYAIQVGYDNGAYFEVINLESGHDIRQVTGAAKQDRWLIVKVIPGKVPLKKQLDFLDENYNLRHSKQLATAYDPRKRPWYKVAHNSNKVEKSAPYYFANLKSPGVTYAGKIKNTAHVVAADITRKTILDFFSSQRFLPSCEIFVFKPDGEIIFSSGTAKSPKSLPSLTPLPLTPEEQAFIDTHPLIRVSNEMDWPPFDFSLGGLPAGYSIDLLNMIAEQAGLELQYVNGYSWNELETMFRSKEIDLLHSLFKTPERELFGAFTQAYADLEQIFVTRIGTPPVTNLKQLYGKTIALPNGWGIKEILEKNHPPIKILAVQTTLQAMKAVANGSVQATIDIKQVVQHLKTAYFLDTLILGETVQELSKGNIRQLHFQVHSENQLLLDILNKGLAAVTPARKQQLEALWGLSPESLRRANTLSQHVVPHRQLLNMAKTRQSLIQTIIVDNKKYLAFTDPLTGLSDQSIGVLVDKTEVLSPYLENIRLSIFTTLGCLILFTPLLWFVASVIVSPIKALVLENRKVKERRWDEIVEVDSNIKEIMTLSKSMISMATAIKDYELSQEEFMDALIKLIASTIDEKSPYTGKHCERVPEIAFMLARAAQKSDLPSLSNFGFENKDQWREFEVAAWLHDCGKITTPEHIVDKGTKLEMIYNRIHEIRMRYEVLLRDARLAYWKNRAEGTAEDPEHVKKLAETEQRLQKEFAFIADCNVGGEFMDPDKTAQLKIIARQTWTRHFDNRLGLSHIEASQYPEYSSLPCEEQLLSDRAEHKLDRDPERHKDDQKFGFNMPVPSLVHNQGELHNLTIGRGTLTEEDRYKIQEHITATIRMLDILPFPEELSRVPEYAGGHHETLVGDGYPRKLVADQISIPGRIMAIADIFEALTASDRPYKKAKPLETVLRIMANMRDKGHIDPDLFQVFLTSKVYMTYAKTFLRPEQVEEVDITNYMKP